MLKCHFVLSARFVFVRSLSLRSRSLWIASARDTEDLADRVVEALPIGWAGDSRGRVWVHLKALYRPKIHAGRVHLP